MFKSLVAFVRNQKNILRLVGLMLFCVLVAYSTQSVSKGHVRFSVSLVATFSFVAIATTLLKRSLSHALVMTAVAMVWSGFVALFPHMIWANVDQDIFDYEHSQSAAAFNLMYSVEDNRLPIDVRQTIEKCFDPRRKLPDDFPNLAKQTYLPELISMRDGEPTGCQPDLLIMTMGKALGAQTPFSSHPLPPDANDLEKETHHVYMEVYAFMDFTQMRRAAFRDTGYLSLYDVWLLNRDYLARRSHLEADFRMLTRKYGYYLWAFRLEG